MTTYYLYVKTHNKTGLKYLGQTSNKNPHSYTGSGKYWKLHLNKHGYDCNTQILKECQSMDELKEFGLYYSDLWNVVESQEWANLKKECGAGGAPIFTDEHRGNLSKSLKGRIFTEEHRQNLSLSGIGHPDRVAPENKADVAKKMSLKLKGRKKPDGFGEKISELLTGRTLPESVKEKMKSAWTPERRAAASERTRRLNQLRRKTSSPIN